MKIRVQIRVLELTVPLVVNGIDVTEEPRLIHDDAGSCRNDNGLPRVGVSSQMPSLEDGQEDLRSCLSCAVVEQS